MHATELRKVPASELTVLPELQRKLNVSRARKIAREWDPTLLGIIEAAAFVDADGTEFLHVIDGGHRAEAARIFGEDNGAEVSLSVVVYEGMTHQDAARLFIARNQLSSKVSAFDQHMVGIESKDELALAIDRAFRKTKFSIGRNASAYVVSAVGAVQSMMRRSHGIHGDSTWKAEIGSLTDTLEVITLGWPMEEGDRVNGDIIRGLFWMMDEYESTFVSDHRDAALLRLGDVLAAKAPREWASEAVTLKAAETQTFSSGQRYKYLVKLWVKAYDRGIKSTELVKLG